MKNEMGIPWSRTRAPRTPTPFHPKLIPPSLPQCTLFAPSLVLCYTDGSATLVTKQRADTVTLTHTSHEIIKAILKRNFEQCSGSDLMGSASIIMEISTDPATIVRLIDNIGCDGDIEISDNFLGRAITYNSIPGNPASLRADITRRVETLVNLHFVTREMLLKKSYDANKKRYFI